MSDWRRQFEQIQHCVVVDGTNATGQGDGDPTICNCSAGDGSQPICKDNKCMNYATQTECVDCYPNCMNNRFQKKLYKELEVKSCGGKGHGLFIKEDVKQGEFIREYVGELISEPEMLQRMKQSARLEKHLYTMKLKNGSYIDARDKGSISRFINHSCEPNCFIDVWTVNERYRVGIFSLKDIPAQSELTFDYKWSPGDDKVPTKCLCGAESCRGTIEVIKDNGAHLVANKSKKGCWRIGNDPTLSVLQRASFHDKFTSTISNGNDYLTSGLPTGTEIDSTPMQIEKPEFSIATSDPSASEPTDSETGQDLPNSAKIPSFGVETEGKDMQLIDTNSSQPIQPVELHDVLSSTATSSENTIGAKLLSSDAEFDEIRDSEGKLVIDKLLDKRVAIYSMDSMEFMEGYIVAADAKEGVFLVKYDFSKDDLPVPIDLKRATWKWFDENFVEVTIRKKSIGVVDYDDDEFPQETNAVLNEANVEAPKPVIVPSSNERSVVLVEYVVAQNVINTAKLMQVSIPDVYEDTEAPEAVWGLLLYLLRENYSVRAFLVEEDGRYMASPQKILLNGDINSVKLAKAGLAQAHSHHMQYLNSLHEQRINSTLSQQSVVLTNDWRITPTNDEISRYASSNIFVMYEDTRLVPAATILQKFFSWIYDHSYSNKNLCDHSLLPVSCGVVVLDGKRLVLSEAVKTSFLKNCYLICNRLQFSKFATFYALNLLLRYLRYVDDSVVLDSTSVLAAIAMITSKVFYFYKVKLMKRIVHVSYCVVFGRDESEDFGTDSNQIFFTKTIEREEKIFVQLLGDLNVANALAGLLVTCSYYMNEANKAIIATSSKKQGWWNDKIYQENKLVDWLASKNTTFANIMRDTMEVCALFSVHLPSVTQAIPCETLQPCILALMAMTDVLINNSTKVPSYSGVDKSLSCSPMFTEAIRMLELQFVNSTIKLKALITELLKQFIGLYAVVLTAASSTLELSVVHKYVKYIANNKKSGFINVLVHNLLRLLDDWLRRYFNGYNNNASVTPEGRNYGRSSHHDEPKRSPPETRRSKDRSYDETDNSTAFACRLPWLWESKENRFVKIQDRLVNYGKDLYGSSLSVEQMASFNMVHVLDTEYHYDLEANPGQVPSTAPVSLKAWPSPKYLHREIKRLRVIAHKTAVLSGTYDASKPFDASNLGIYCYSLAELSMLQTVHYEYIDGNLKKSGSCPFFLEPFAIAEQSDEDLKKSKQGVEAVEDISDVEDDRFPNSGDMNMLNMKWRYLVSSPVLMTLKGLLPLYGKPNRIGGMNGLLDRPWVSPFLTIDWCRDLLLAVNHLLNCGICLRWLAIEQIFISITGRLVIGGLEGAVRLELQDVVKAIPDAERLQAINKMDITSTIDEKSANVSFLNPDNSSGTMFYEEYMLESNATNNNEDVDSSKRVISDEDEEEIVDPRLRRKLEKKKKNQERREKSEKRKKKKHRENKIPEEDQEKTDPSASALTQPLIETHLSPIPSGCYNTTAPEVLLGGQASLQSTVYVVGTLLAYLLIGQPVIKNASSDAKQMQHIYKTLGTPKVLHYKEAFQLPKAEMLGTSIKDEATDKTVESRSRIVKTLQKLFPSFLSKHFSYKVSEEGDNGGIVDLLVGALQLVPYHRRSVGDLLTLPVFNYMRKKISYDNMDGGLEIYETQLKVKTATFSEHVIPINELSPECRYSLVKTLSDQLATGRDRSKNETSAKSFAVINSDILIVGERKIQLEKYLKADFTVMSNKQSAVANPSPNIDRTSNKDAQQRQKRKWDGSPEAGSRSEQTHRGSYRYHSSSTSFSDYPDDSGHYSGRSDSYYDRRYKSEDYRNNRAGYH